MRYFAWVFFLGFGLLGACDGDTNGGADTPGVQEPADAEGETGGTPDSSDEPDLSDVPDISDGSGEECVGECCEGWCEDNCVEGETRCESSLVQKVCVRQASGYFDWESVPCPGNSTCEEDACTSCPEGGRQCHEDGVHVMGCVDHGWAKVEECAFGCQGGDCVEEVSCTAGEKRCFGGSVEKCNQAGTAFLQMEICEDGCESGACVGPCSWGDYRCNGNTLETCDMGEWEQQPCGVLSCSELVGECVERSLFINDDVTMDGIVHVDGPVIIDDYAYISVPSGQLTIIADSFQMAKLASIVVSPTGEWEGRNGQDASQRDWAYGGGGGGNATPGGTAPSAGPAAPGGRGGAAFGGNIHDLGPGGKGGDGYIYGRNAPQSIWPESEGGFGGGFVTIQTQGPIVFDGWVKLNAQRGGGGNMCGGDGSMAVGAGGGGAGGTLLLSGATVSNSPGSTALAETMPGSGSSCTAGRGSGAGGKGLVVALSADGVVGTGEGFVEESETVLVKSVAVPRAIHSSSHPSEFGVYTDGFENFVFSWERPFAESHGYYVGIFTDSEDTPQPGAPGTRYVASESVVLPRGDRADGEYFFILVPADRNRNPGSLKITYRVQLSSEVPQLSSSTHPDEEAWYESGDIQAGWSPLSSRTSETKFVFVVDQYGDTRPGDDADQRAGDHTQLHWTVSPGIWALHLAVRDAKGRITREVARRIYRVGPDPGVGGLKGTVRDVNGDPLSGVTLEINRGLLPGTTTNAQGSFDFNGAVVAGEWELRLSKPGYQTRVERISVEQGGEVDGNYVLSR